LNGEKDSNLHRKTEAVLVASNDIGLKTMFRRLK